MPALRLTTILNNWLNESLVFLVVQLRIPIYSLYVRIPSLKVYIMCIWNDTWSACEFLNTCHILHLASGEGATNGLSRVDNMDHLDSFPSSHVQYKSVHQSLKIVVWCDAGTTEGNIPVLESYKLFSNVVHINVSSMRSHVIYNRCTE